MCKWRDPYYLRRQGLSCSLDDASQLVEVLGNPMAWMNSDARRDFQPPKLGWLNRAVQGTRPYLASRVWQG